MADGLSLLDKLLPLWILLSMALGLILGYFVPSSSTSLSSLQIVDVSLPLFIGLLLMMYPILCKVKYEQLHILFRKNTNQQSHSSSPSTLHIILSSTLINWVFAPLLMTALAWATLPDLPGYRNGIILVVRILHNFCMITISMTLQIFIGCGSLYSYGFDMESTGERTYRLVRYPCGCQCYFTINSLCTIGLFPLCCVGPRLFKPSH